PKLAFLLALAVSTTALNLSSNFDVDISTTPVELSSDFNIDADCELDCGASCEAWFPIGYCSKASALAFRNARPKAIEMTKGGQSRHSKLIGTSGACTVLDSTGLWLKPP